MTTSLIPALAPQSAYAMEVMDLPQIHPDFQTQTRPPLEPLEPPFSTLEDPATSAGKKANQRFDQHNKRLQQLQLSVSMPLPTNGDAEEKARVSAMQQRLVDVQVRIAAASVGLEGWERRIQLGGEERGFQSEEPRFSEHREVDVEAWKLWMQPARDWHLDLHRQISEAQIRSAEERRWDALRLTIPLEKAAEGKRSNVQG